jgi:thiol-disulfide isomerase/thioredoxin
MKRYNLLLVLPALLVSQMLLAQNSSHLILSDNYPAAAKKIKITYNPTGTPIAGKTDIGAEVYFIGAKENPPVDLDLKAHGNILNSEFTIPDSTRAFFIKVFSGNDIDNNNDKGYIFLIYKNKKPVEGAYGTRGFILASGFGTYMAKIKKDDDAALASFQKEKELYPASERTEIYYYQLLATKKDPRSLALVNEKIASLEKSDKEKDQILASNILYSIKGQAGYDSLKAMIIKRFPDGESVRSDAEFAFYKENFLVKKDSLFKAYISKYPEKPGDQRSFYDYARIQLASFYLKSGDAAKSNEYATQVKNKLNLAGDYNNVAWQWALKGEKLDEAEKLSKQSLDIVQDAIKNPVPSPYNSAKTQLKNNKGSYDMYADTYAFILYKEGKYAEALKYQQPVYEHNAGDYAETNEHYVLILNALGKYDITKQVIEKAMKAGKGSQILIDELKKAYVGANGNETGYDKYLAGLMEASQKIRRGELLKEMINKPAMAFALKDLDGNTVSLADLKGKTVIVDFWATWCGPCKASFPGMQMAVNKYKDDPNVKFLFVDTWEHEANYVDGVKKFIADNKYTFNVLLDEKDANGKQAKVVSQFEVNGIPTKFIIDKNGVIRFKKVGFQGSPDDLVSEISVMIDLANEPQVAAATGK